MVQELPHQTEDAFILEKVLDPNQLDYLRDHTLNGIAILPGVMGIDGFISAARARIKHLVKNSESFTISLLKNIRFMQALKFYRDLPRKVIWRVFQPQLQQDALITDVALESDTQHTKGTLHMVHFTGSVMMQQQTPAAQFCPPPSQQSVVKITQNDIYRLYSHGPFFQVLQTAWASGRKVIGAFSQKLMREVKYLSPYSAIPQLVELCFQTAGLWEAGIQQYLGLPLSMAKLKIYQPVVDFTRQIYAEVLPIITADNQISFDAKVFDADGLILLEIENYQTFPLPYALKPEHVEPCKAIFEGKTA